MHLTRCHVATIITAGTLALVSACGTSGDSAASSSGGQPGTGASSTTAPAQGTGATTPAAVTKPARDEFAVCDTARTSTDAAGLTRCGQQAHQIPLGAKSLTCLANLGTTAPATARLKVTYSVFRQGRNVAYERDIPHDRYTVRGFQVRYDFTPQDAEFWGDATLPPGSYYCEWYDPQDTRIGSVDVIHGQLPSSTVGTPGAAY